MQKQKKYMIILLIALSSSLYSIIPIFALLTNNISISALFSWIQLFRPVLIILVIILLCIAWFKKLRPPVVPGVCILNPLGLEKVPFYRTRLYLFIITIISTVLMLFPYWGQVLINQKHQEMPRVHYSNISQNTIYIDKIKCDACRNTIISYVYGLEGIISAKFSLKKSHLFIKFDTSKNDIENIVFSISKTGFTAKEIH